MSARNDLLEKLASKSKERHNKHFEWLRGLLVMASGLIGILIALKSDKSQTEFEHWLFVASISLLGIGILTGTVALYGDTNTDKKMEEQIIKAIIEESEGKTHPKEITILASPGGFYNTMETVCYAALVLSVVALVVYSAVSDTIPAQHHCCAMLG